MTGRFWTHNELQTDLANHLHAGGGLLIWTNIVMGQSGAPRPDVLTLDALSWAHLNFVAYEVKISVSDFRSDTKSGKWQQYLSFAQGVTFAVPKGLVSIGDVPKDAGLIERGETAWRWKRRPTLGTARLTNDQMIKLAREPTHRPTVPFTDANEERWRRERLNRFEAEVMRRAMRKIGERLGRKIAQYLADSDAAEGVIAAARKQAKQIVESATERTALERQTIDDAWAELGRLFGLETDVGRYAIKRAIQDAAARLAKDGEVAHLRGQLSAIERALSDARPLAVETKRGRA
jgi:hypothetical protein